jgi:isopenicillin-N N-acyltransferase-like protein
MPTFPHVRVQGKPRERGRQYGEQARERIGRSIAAYRAVFRHYAGWSWSKVIREARRYEEPIAAYGAAYLEELRSCAASPTAPAWGSRTCWRSTPAPR